MTGPKSENSPLARLVLLRVCLSIAGSVLAGVHYFTVDLPSQKAVQPPTNSATGLQQCEDNCQNHEGDGGFRLWWHARSRAS